MTPTITTNTILIATIKVQPSPPTYTGHDMPGTVQYSTVQSSPPTYTGHDFMLGTDAL